MSKHIIKIIGTKAKQDDVIKYAEQCSAMRYWKDGQDEFNVLIGSENVQSLTDKLQTLLSSEEGWHIITLPVESVIPKPQEEDDNAQKSVSETITREALYERIKRGAKLDTDFLILTVLSTIVAAIGIINDNVAIVIAAMVIAPLLGPNLALSFSVTLGDKALMAQALKTNAAGLSLTLLMAILFGLSVPNDFYIENIEYMTRVEVGLSAIVLALASGSAAVLSLTSGISSAMVGVMVAVAMMPPAVVLGLSMGAGSWTEAYHAGLLLAVNIICVNLSAKVIMSFKGIRPRTWYQRKKTNQSVRLSIIVWAILLTILSVLIYLGSHQL